MRIFYKIGAPKNFAKITGKHLCWSHLAIKLQVSRPEISSKRDFSTGTFLWISQNFSKNVIYRTTPDDCSCWFFRFNQSFIHWSLFCLLHLFPFITDNCNYGRVFRKGTKKKIFYFLQKFIEKLTCMLLRQFCLGNNLPTHIRKNTDFPRQSPRQLPSAKANFEGCICISLISFLVFTT